MNSKPKEAPFSLRLPVGVRHCVEEIAKENRRSINAELGLLIEEALFLRAAEREKGKAIAS